MKKFITSLLAAGLLTALAASASANTECTNPFFKEWNTPYGTAPFAEIKFEYYRPAFDAAIDETRMDIAYIVDNEAAPTFENTIVALDMAGPLMNRVAGVFYNLASADTNDDLKALSTEMSPILAALQDEVNLNEKLWMRIKTVWDQRASLDLNTEQTKLLTDTYKGFARRGANLNDADKETLTGINKELAELTTKFGQDWLTENNAFELVLDETDLAGLPESVRASGKSAATQKGLDDKWVYGLNRTGINPFLTYSDRRDLREKIYTAYIKRGSNSNATDSRETLRRIANLRLQRANLLGYPTHADYVLEVNMAKNPKNVYGLLDKIWPAAQDRARQEVKDMQKLINAEGGDYKLKAWDWRKYSEQVRKARYDLDEEAIKQYFVLENVRDSAFQTASKLFGITFHERNDIEVYHPDVKVFEVRQVGGGHIGILYNDYFARPSKRGGAWMNAYRGQHREEGKNITPIIVNVWNYSKPADGKPSLLSWDEASTFFHEFGHALHGLLSEATYPSLAGTATPRDYVEFPSQVFENWASQPEVMRTYAKHWQSGEVIPDAVIERLAKASTFNEGFATTEYLAASYLDLAWHTITEPVTEDALVFEKKALDKLGLIAEIDPRYRSPYFAHIFSGGYSSGYYGYIWAQVLDADAFALFEEKGIFNPEISKRFRSEILSQGGTDDVMQLYINFRGREPEIEPLLKRRGFLDK
ncbi:MAG: M3 family metallopeptidase [Proteobacteria bacterium]|nr:M3 family metallopeptidase [Pseudomonadota bacterium]